MLIVDVRQVSESQTSNLQIKFCCAILWPLGGSMVNNKTQLDELMKKPLQFSSV